MKPGEKKTKQKPQKATLDEVIYDKLGLGWQHNLGEKILTSLLDRKGFDKWWDSIDEDIRGEIIEEMFGNICDFFENK